jgi:hypothetical protein
MSSRPSQPPPKPTPAGIRQRTVDYCRRVKCPILIGNLAVELGWWANLRPMEDLLESLVDEGVLRRLTQDECRKFDVYFAYALV